MTRAVLTSVAWRVRRRRAFRWEAWVLCRAYDDTDTDLWFYVGKTWSRAGARGLALDFHYLTQPESDHEVTAL